MAIQPETPKKTCSFGSDSVIVETGKRLPIRSVSISNMSAEFNQDEHLAEIFDAMLRVLPACTNGVDFSNTGGEGRFSHGGKSDSQIVTDRAWDLGKACVAKYHAEVEAASARADKDRERAEHYAGKKGVTHG